MSSNNRHDTHEAAATTDTKGSEIPTFLPPAVEKSVPAVAPLSLPSGPKNKSHEQANDPRYYPANTSTAFDVSVAELYFNRELSWVEFNSRVLEEALLPDTPLLERLKFLGIFTSNLDEFFMVRVAGLVKMLQEGIRVTESPDHLDTSATLEAIRARVQELLVVQYRCLYEQVLPGLEAHDIKIIKVEELTETQRHDVDLYFENEVSPVLTPLACDAAHPFPFLSNQAIYLVVLPKDPEIRGDLDAPAVGFVEVPAVIPRLIPIRTRVKDEVRFILLEDLIAANLSSLFFGFGVEGIYTIRVTRNLDYTLLENKVVDLLKSIQREVVNREHQEVVRLEVEPGLPAGVKALLINRLAITPRDIYEMPRPLYLHGLMDLYNLPKDIFKDPPFNPRLPEALAGSDDIFAVISKKDLLVHHPFESFYAVTDFLNSAAHDPNVLAIKQTLYRTAGDSPIIDALIAAAENGKQVTAVVELKARFDEKNNITWARRLERVGVNVVFGFVGLKTHGKATLVVRREKSGLKRYVHISTGNYNSSTAKLYTDLGLFSASEDLGDDVASLFNLVTGFDILTGGSKFRAKATLPSLAKIAFAPVNLRQHIIQQIDNEIDSIRKHGSGFIMAKMNALIDVDIINALYRASQAGVQIKLIVRGMCCLRPGIKGISENIEVISIIDRFLEHSRVFYFQAAGKHRVFISSADWMSRNMDRRIEFCCPIEDPEIKARIIEEILKTYWADNVKARELRTDGTYVRRTPAAGKAPIRAQQRFIDLAREGGIQSLPYELAIRYNPVTQRGQRPVAKKGKKKG
jgi:polyphosphate kinase